MELLNQLVTTVFESFGSSTRKEVYQTGTMLMAHLDCFDRLITDRTLELENELKKVEENKKVLLHNKINRF